MTIGNKLNRTAKDETDMKAITTVLMVIVKNSLSYSGRSDCCTDDNFIKIEISKRKARKSCPILYFLLE